MHYSTPAHIVAVFSIVSFCLPGANPMRRRFQHGGTLVEAAIALPIFFLFVLATVEFGLVYSAYHSMVGAVRQGARYGAAPDPNNSYTAPSAVAIANVVCLKLQAGVFGPIAPCTGPNGGYLALSGTPASTAACPPFSGGTAPALTSEDVYVNYCTMGAGPFNGSTQPGTEKYVQVAVHRQVSLLFGWTIPLSTRAVMRMETN
jgi:hypothetical protein